VKNIYQFDVRAQCPVNPTDTDCYDFTVESQDIIEVEKIIAWVVANAGAKNSFQEHLTLKCAVTLGAKVTSVGWHSGVKVTCEAP
jgi:hypothetical protein